MEYGTVYLLSVHWRTFFVKLDANIDKILEL